MKIVLKNIGIVREASVEVIGLTVIAGHNDTGKSTIGKVFEVIFKSLCFDRNSLEEYKKNRLHEITQYFIRVVESNFPHEYKNIRDLFQGDINTINTRIIYKSINTEFIREFIRRLKKTKLKEDLLLEKISYHVKYSNNENLYDLLNDVYLDLSKNQVNKKPRDTFYSNRSTNISDSIARLLNIKQKQILLSEVELILKNYERSTLFFDKEIREIEKFIELIEQVDNFSKEDLFDLKLKSFIKSKFSENPSNKFLPNTEKSRVSFSFDGKNIFCEYLYPEEKVKLSVENIGETTNVISLMLTGDNLSKKPDLNNLSEETNDVITEIKSIINGEFVLDDYGDILFKKNNNFFDLDKTASGIKSFGILYRLLINGSINRYTLLIIDEPEIHMHPEWQFKMAEVLILISQKLYVHILITTHSDILIRAIETFSKKYSYSNKTIFYYASRKKDNRLVSTIIEQIPDEIYDDLASPYRLIRKEEANLD